MATHPADAPYTAPEPWAATAPRCDGSWWPAWTTWLTRLSGPVEAPPELGAAKKGFPCLQAAPGSYVLQP
jgi:polyhydroxyalkanoate synthase